MFLKSLKLVNWRSYDEAVFDFNEGINILVGENARGKTNVLEAAVVLATTKSFRTNRDRSLVKLNEDFAKIMGDFKRGGQDQKEEVRLIFDDKNDFKKELRLDGVVVRALDIIGKLRVVVFSPDEIDSFYNMAAKRRRWLDLILSMVDFDYAYTSAVYKKVVLNRNKVLKRIANNKANTDELKFWDEKWLLLAEKMIGKRRELMAFLSGEIGKFYNNLFGCEENIGLEYAQSYEGSDLNDGLSLELEKKYQRELRYGNTIVGPHREDMIVQMNGVDMSQWGSRAQARLGLLSLKLAECEYIKEVTGEYPVLLLDDIFSELDDNNRGRVLDYIKGRQVIITTTSLDGLGDLKDVKVIKI